MSGRLRLAITADLHWGHRKGREPTELLVRHLLESPPEVLILAGDVGTAEFFEQCLELFAELDCRKVVLPGNHDLWVPLEEERFDSLELYEKILPEISRRQGFHYLDQEPLTFPEANLALVGGINWYDYSWSLEQIRQHFPQEEDRLKSKRFSRGKHNDANFVRWHLDDQSFTAQVRDRLHRHLEAVAGSGRRVLVVTHHPPIYPLGFPNPVEPMDLDRLLWDAFCGNVGVERLLQEYASQIAFAFCGHTHRAREVLWEGIRGYNIGGDYHFKRLLELDWPEGTVRESTFGEP